MKGKGLRRVCALMLTVALSLGVAGVALADVPAPTPTGAVSYKGNNVFEYHPDEANMTLWNFTNVMPGDELYRTVSIKNSFARAIEVYLRAEPANPDNAEELDFLSKLTFEVARGADMLNSALTSGDDAWPNGALSAENEKNKLYYLELGSVSSGSSMELTVKLTVPKELSNVYQEATGEIRWVIVIVEEQYVSPTDSPVVTYPPYYTYPPYPSYSPYVPSTPELIPLGPPIVEVDGEEIPLGVPYTGDEESKAPVAVIAASATLAALAVAALIIRKRGKKKA